MALGSAAQSFYSMEWRFNIWAYVKQNTPRHASFGRSRSSEYEKAHINRILLYVKDWKDKEETTHERISQRWISLQVARSNNCYKHVKRGCNIQSRTKTKRKRRETVSFSFFFLLPRLQVGKYQVTPSGYVCVLCSSTLLQFSHR